MSSSSNSAVFKLIQRNIHTNCDDVIMKAAKGIEQDITELLSSMLRYADDH